MGNISLKIYGVYFKFGAGHDQYAGDIDAISTKKAFELAVEKYFDNKMYSKYTAFYVHTAVIDEDYRAYGYSNLGSRHSSNGFFSSGKWMIDKFIKETDEIKNLV